MRQVYLIWYLKRNSIEYGIDSCAETLELAQKKCDEKNDNKLGIMYSVGNNPIELFEAPHD
jgi:hypothetical protein